eukprot:6850402-Prymnesium_polylepis.1
MRIEIACQAAEQLDGLPIKARWSIPAADESSGATLTILNARPQGGAVAPEHREEEKLHAHGPQDNHGNGNEDHVLVVIPITDHRQVTPQVVDTGTWAGGVRDAIPDREDRAAHTWQHQENDKEDPRQQCRGERQRYLG